MIPVVIGHGLVGRADLPVPAAWFAAAAAAVLVVSFAGLAAGWSRPRLEQAAEPALARVPVAVEVLAGAAGIALFALVVAAGLAGPATPTENLAPSAIYVLFWVGIPLTSLLLGDVFRPLNPWRAIGRAGGWLAQRASGAAATEPLPYPDRLGRWPAAAGLLGFAAVELTWGRGDDPRALAVLALGYAAIQLVGMSLFGVRTWCDRADAFGVYFGLIASLAPIACRGRLILLRVPVAGAAAVRAVPGTAALLLVGIGSTMFDGAREGRVLGPVLGDLQDAFFELGLGKGPALELAFLLGLLASVGLVAAIYGSGVADMRGGGPLAARAAAMAHSLIPIAAAYVVAHYFSLLAYQGQAALALVSDPLGSGADLLGTAGREIDYGIVSATGIWWVQVISLAAGHVAALMLAHDRALLLHTSPRVAVRSQVAMLVVMIAFTCLGLWQLSEASA